tara:strand:- start:4016 stop:4414 length:399 start_codon:yes stop_codon:yes gene_type:complete
MDPRIEQVLLAQAAKEAEEGPGLNEAIALGAGGGAAIGALGGSVPHALGKGIGHLRGTNQFMKPGLRMAGSLVGTLLGGGLGAAAQAQAISEAGPAGALLAKIQSQGGLMPGDEARLEAVLRDAYSQQGLIG